mmetsp:Transcript_23715/g.40837  ORF Transcript_23715/g.40837 Transcript_23715/m.40837 type:complete len:320 (-) Transcript_23715:280-1239(-)|eukprot:CAMPEP_0196656944 /NCGR_PEP_ID=MMETSP1086-20130531/20534_1 /TAXON_ID=77921 /ORGANISM="Cyanoptyche  gloeocystis , Strain SAG4.97" /LENGTH=319 /DNA_ID=CAMNT_0041989875 /DNA_START=88 /DNA_END=1047 /DNA_ORIENTATION=-
MKEDFRNGEMNEKCRKKKERNAFAAVLIAFKAAGELTWRKRELLMHLRKELRISASRAECEELRIGRQDGSDENIQEIANVNFSDTDSESDPDSPGANLSSNRHVSFQDDFTRVDRPSKRRRNSKEQQQLVQSVLSKTSGSSHRQPSTQSRNRKDSSRSHDSSSRSICSEVISLDKPRILQTDHSGDCSVLTETTISRFGLGEHENGNKKLLSNQSPSSVDTVIGKVDQAPPSARQTLSLDLTGVAGLGIDPSLRTPRTPAEVALVKSRLQEERERIKARLAEMANVSEDDEEQSSMILRPPLPNVSLARSLDRTLYAG